MMWNEIYLVPEEFYFAFEPDPYSRKCDAFIPVYQGRGFRGYMNLFPNPIPEPIQKYYQIVKKPVFMCFRAMFHHSGYLPWRKRRKM